MRLSRSFRSLGIATTTAAIVAASGCDAAPETSSGAVAKPKTGGKADGADGDVEPGPFAGAPLARLSAGDLLETSSARYAPLTTAPGDFVSVVVHDDAPPEVVLHQADEVRSLDLFFNANATTDVRIDPAHEQIVFSQVQPAHGASDCCGPPPGFLAVGILDTSEDGGSWTQRIRRPFVNERVQASSVALDEAGEVHIAYVRDTGGKTFEYANCTGGQTCELEVIDELDEARAAVALVLSADGRHQALFAIDLGIAVYEREPSGQWSEQSFIDSGWQVQRMVSEQGYGRAVVVAQSRLGSDQVVEVYGAALGDAESWSKLETLEHPWVLNSDRSNRNVEARLTQGGVVVATGTCFEHVEDDDDVTCARGGWRVFREGDGFAMEEIFVEGVRSAAAPVLGDDGEPYHLGKTRQTFSLQPAVGVVRDPAYHYDAVDLGHVGISGDVHTVLDIRFPSPWSGEWTDDAVEAPARFDCRLGGHNPGFVQLSCSVRIEDPSGPFEVSRAFRRELDESMTVVDATSEQSFVAHVERTDGITEVVIDGFQFFVDSPNSAADGTPRLSSPPPIRVPLTRG